MPVLTIKRVSSFTITWDGHEETENTIPSNVYCYYLSFILQYQDILIQLAQNILIVTDQGNAIFPQTLRTQLKKTRFVCHFFPNHVTALTISHFLFKCLKNCLMAIVRFLKKCLVHRHLDNINSKDSAISNNCVNLQPHRRHTSIQLSITAEKSPTVCLTIH